MNSKTITPAILLVDDEEELLFSSRLILRRAGFNTVLTQSDSRLVMGMLAEQPVALVLLDMTMPYLTGGELLKQIKAAHPDIAVVMLTAVNDLETAVACIQAGADDYLVKPVERERLAATVRNSYELACTRRQLDQLQRSLAEGKLGNESAFSGIVTVSQRMRNIFLYLESVAPSRQPMLITGETGTGKELVARSVHELSGRSGRFVAVNLAGLDDTIFSDTLFGHQRGAFTGAERAREGLIRQAAGGTLFLDEIGDLSLSSQVKLLRLLQEGEYLPLGSDTASKSDARIVAATHADLKERMENGSFRADLYYRLCAHQVALPPLRERREDIPLLVDHFIEKAAASLGKPRPVAPPELGRYLAAYLFPGNIRELEAMIHDAVARNSGRILALESFAEEIGGKLAVSAVTIDVTERCPVCPLRGKFPTLKESEDLLIAEALRLSGNNQRLAAAYLGISRQALNKRLSRSEH